MNCADFEDLWNEVLDDPKAGPSGLEQRLEEHAASCPSCRSIAIGYQTIRQAIGALEPPVPSPESSSRLLALMVAAPRPAPRRPARKLARFAWVPLASAAALLLVAWPGRTPRPAPPPASRPADPSPASAAYRPIDSTLADARTASIELAREASAPAARIGLEWLVDRARGDEAAQAPAQPDTDGLGAPPSELIQSVGERLTAGVRPISGSARHAFGFLLGPPPVPPTQKSL